MVGPSVAAIIAVGHFLLPFFALMAPRLRRTRRGPGRRCHAVDRHGSATCLVAGAAGRPSVHLGGSTWLPCWRSAGFRGWYGAARVSPVTMSLRSKPWLEHESSLPPARYEPDGCCVLVLLFGLVGRLLAAILLSLLLVIWIYPSITLEQATNGAVAVVSATSPAI